MTPLRVTPEQFEFAVKNGYFCMAIDAYSRVFKIAEYVELQCWTSSTEVKTIEMIVTNRHTLYNHIYRNDDEIHLVTLKTYK